MDKTLIEKLEREINVRFCDPLIFQSPRIAVVGATFPDASYRAEMSQELGFKLRSLIESENQGTLFSGGVGGVGVDFFRGIVDYSKVNKIESRFFVSFPEDHLPDIDYFRYAAELNENLNIVLSGKDLTERRKVLANIADALVVINGGAGTLDEAEHAYNLGKKLYCFASSGGAAAQLAEYANDRILVYQDIDSIVRDLKKHQFNLTNPTVSYFPNLSERDFP